MTRHRFDLVSAVLAVFAVAGGVAVMTGESDWPGASAGWWVSAAALIIGLAMIPRRSTQLGSADHTTPPTRER